jgi:hypothetical protein
MTRRRDLTLDGYQLIVTRRFVGWVWSVWPLEPAGPRAADGWAWTQESALRAAFRAVKEQQP